MLGIWACCYSEVYGEARCGLWSARAIDALFALNFVAVGTFLYRSTEDPLGLLSGILMVTGGLIATALIWYFGSLSVSGFYF
jgi:hypothetical protein